MNDLAGAGAEVTLAVCTPTFFINSTRHYDAYDIDRLKAAVENAQARVQITAAR